MGATPIIQAPRDLDAEQRRDVERFERAIAVYEAGEIDEDVFRVVRLDSGIDGQRQDGTNQTMRMRLPAGSVTPEQLDMMGYLAGTADLGFFGAERRAQGASAPGCQLLLGGYVGAEVGESEWAV